MRRDTDLNVLAALAERDNAVRFYALCLDKAEQVGRAIDRRRDAGQPFAHLIPEQVHQLELARQTRQSWGFQS